MPAHVTNDMEVTDPELLGECETLSPPAATETRA